MAHPGHLAGIRSFSAGFNNPLAYSPEPAGAVTRIPGSVNQTETPARAQNASLGRPLGQTEVDRPGQMGIGLARLRCAERVVLKTNGHKVVQSGIRKKRIKAFRACTF